MKTINQKLRKWFVIAGLVVISAGISSIFWYNEWVYSLPTPIPTNYHDVKAGTLISLNGKLKSVDHKPILLHFFNPDCPCSRFNIPHFKSLVQKYGTKVSFVIVLLNKDKSYSEEEIQDKIGLTLPVLTDQSIAQTCGVYSTPQAVILDADHKLYYRGNYNRSRYCNDEKSAYAQFALDSMLNHSHTPQFDELAMKAYGCQLPNCTLK